MKQNNICSLNCFTLIFLTFPLLFSFITRFLKQEWNSKIIYCKWPRGRFLTENWIQWILLQFKVSPRAEQNQRKAAYQKCAIGTNWNTWWNVVPLKSTKCCQALKASSGILTCHPPHCPPSGQATFSAWAYSPFSISVYSLALALPLAWAYAVVSQTGQDVWSTKAAGQLLGLGRWNWSESNQFSPPHLPALCWAISMHGLTAG